MIRRNLIFLLIWEIIVMSSIVFMSEFNKYHELYYNYELLHEEARLNIVIRLSKCQIPHSSFSYVDWF